MDGRQRTSGRVGLLAAACLTRLSRRPDRRGPRAAVAAAMAAGWPAVVGTGWLCQRLEASHLDTSIMRCCGGRGSLRFVP